jgi:hypothetical protein
LSRAYGTFVPEDDVWAGPGGIFIDAFRPQIQPNGFASIMELMRQRDCHFSAVRRAVEEADVFIFTLGLTEAWESVADGSVYPICPGVSGLGKFDKQKYRFANYSVSSIVSDLRAAINMIREHNDRIKIILTVSPVPLIATAEDRSVLVSTTYSKSALRVAAEEISGDDDRIAYFPSYEIITGNFNRGAYFAKDLRTVTETGVQHVMRLFLRHYTDGMSVREPQGSEKGNPTGDLQAIEAAVRLFCEEEALGQQ